MQDRKSKEMQEAIAALERFVEEGNAAEMATRERELRLMQAHMELPIE